MTEDQARAAVDAAGIALSGAFIDILDAIASALTEACPSLCPVDIEQTAANLASLIAE